MAKFKREDQRFRQKVQKERLHGDTEIRGDVFAVP
jgi:hypothetical protein